MSAPLKVDPFQDTNSLEIEKFADNRMTCLRFRGAMNEHFDGKKLGSAIKGKILLLELSGINRISSFGIREWMNFLGVVEKATEQIFLIGVSTKLVDQMNIVEGLLGKKALVFSFLANYRCDQCDAAEPELLNVDRDYEAIKKSKAPERACQKCGSETYLDDDPVGYFSFVAKQPQFELGQDIATFLIAKLNYAVSDIARRIQAEKTIEGHYTYLRLAGNLDENFPRQKLLDGLEGSVLLDVSEVGGMDTQGAAEFRRFLSILKAAADRILLVGCQPILLERTTRPGDVDQTLQVHSFSMPYACEKCKITLPQHIDFQKHYNVLKIAMPPKMKCPDCGSRTQCVATKEMLAHIQNLPPIDVDKDLQKLIKKAVKRRRKGANVQKEAEGGGGLSPRAIIALGAIFVLAVAGLGGVTYYQQQKGEAMVKKAVAALSSAAAQKRPNWIISGTPSSAYCTDFANRSACVGVSTFVDDKEVGRTEAWNSAMEALINTIGLRIEDLEFGRHVRPAYADARQGVLTAFHRGEEGADRGAALEPMREGRARVAQAFEATGGSAVPTQYSAWYWEEYEAKQRPGSEYLVFVRLDVPTETMAVITQRYSRATKVQGASVVTTFPSLAWSHPEAKSGAFVLSPGKGILRELGLKPQDVITEVNGSSIRDAGALAQLLPPAVRSGKVVIRGHDAQGNSFERSR